MIAERRRQPFFGWVVVWAAFVTAIFGWGVGFYGPPVFLKAVQDARGWSVSLVSAAVTLHFLVGAVVVASLPRLHRRFGLPAVTTTGAAVLAVGVLGWSLAQEPWQLFAGHAPLGRRLGDVGGGSDQRHGVALVRAQAPGRPLDRLQRRQHRRRRVLPLVGGVDRLGRVSAGSGDGRRRHDHGCRLPRLRAFSTGRPPSSVSVRTVRARQLRPRCAAPGTPRKVAALWADAAFLTLALGMALGLFAQIGLIAHLYSLLAPALGAQGAGLAAGMATAAAILGRTLAGWLMPPAADRRVDRGPAASASRRWAVLRCCSPRDRRSRLLLVGVAMVGLGIGNATSLPPLIAQVEFAKADLPRVVALVTATSQATYALAPAAFGLLRDLTAVDRLSRHTGSVSCSRQPFSSWPRWPMSVGANGSPTLSLVGVAAASAFARQGRRSTDMLRRGGGW